MSASAKSTKSTALTTLKCTTTNGTLLERLKTVTSALKGEQLTSLSQENDGGVQIRKWEMELLADGGYNHVWLVTYIEERQDEEHRIVETVKKVVIREPNANASQAQMENEIAFLTYLAKHHPSIPVPKVYAYSTEQSGSNSPYIAMEYLEGEPLDAAWYKLSQVEKEIIVDEIAQILVELGEIDLGAIGALTLNHTLGPTVEGIKLFRGRHKFHSSEYYDIGPYPSTHSYVLACYDKEIYYYTHASTEDLGEDLFEHEDQRSRYIAWLQATRDRLFLDPSPFLPQEPIALVHGDLCGRNIMVHNGHVCAIIDWEFAGSYPLSELLGGGGVEMFELEDENLTEYNEWDEKIRDLIVDKARARGWEDDKIALLVGQGNSELQLARREMVPIAGEFDDDVTDRKDDEVQETCESVSNLVVDE